MKKRFLLFIFIIINVCTAFHAGAYTISGNIPGEYASDVVVTLSGDAQGVTVTDENGDYEFTGLPGGGTYTITPSKSYTPPQVTIVNPEPYDSLIGNVTITTDVTADYCGYAFEPQDITITSLDNDYTNQDFQVLITSCCFIVSNVETYVDDTLIDAQSADDMCQGSYTYVLDTSHYSNGAHTISVTAADDNGGTGSMEIPVVINNDTDALFGDVNMDGEVSIVDALLAAQYYVAIDPEEFDTPLGDVNLDNSVTIVDALLIAQYYVGLLSELPEAKPGGYSRISTSQESALDAYTFLEAYLADNQPEVTLGVVKLAFSQVVAGLNVRLIASYYSTETRKDQYVAAVVFINLDMVPETIQSLDWDVY
jgi:hypothetical protein